MAFVDEAAGGQAARKVKVGLAVALCVALAACSAPDDAGKPATQVAARVNSSEISIHQVNFALQRTHGLSPETVSEAKRQILDELVDQELAVQEALAAKLDRSPNVMQAVDAARREILARAYMEQVAAGAQRPTPEEIGAYYRGHPELFTGRKIYHLQELLLPQAPEIMAKAREQVALGRNAADLEAWFKGRQFKVGSRVVIKPAEKIDLEILPRLAAMKEGQTTLIEKDGEASVVTVLALIPVPLAEDDARPLIDEYLKRQRGEALEKETARRLRAKASIEYLGEFSPDAEAARKRKSAEAERRIEEARAAREAARQARVAEMAGRPSAASLLGDAADSPQSRPASLPAPAESAIGKGVADLD